MTKAVLNSKSTLDATDFDRGLKQMSNGVKTFTTVQLKTVAKAMTAAFSVGAITSWGREVIKRSDDLGNLSNAVGMNVEALQAMQWAIKEFGAGTQDDATSKLVKLVDAQDKVVNGNSKLAEAFGRLGISEKEVASLGTEELLYRVAKGAQSSGTAVGDLNLIFGKGAAFIMKDALDKLANDGMDGLITKAREAGQVLDDSLISSLGQLNDDLERTTTQASNFFVKLSAHISNAIKDFSSFLGAVSAVGLSEAWQQLTTGQIGVNRERSDSSRSKEKEKARRDAEKQAKIDAYNLRKEEAKRELQTKIDKIMNAPMKDISVSAPTASDQYAQMGLFSGGQVDNQFRAIAERQLKVQEEMQKRLEKIEEIQQKTEKNTADAVDLLEG